MLKLTKAGATRAMRLSQETRNILTGSTVSNDSLTEVHKIMVEHVRAISDNDYFELLKYCGPKVRGDIYMALLYLRDLNSNWDRRDVTRSQLTRETITEVLVIGPNAWSELSSI